MTGGVAQGVGPVVKPQDWGKKKKKDWNHVAYV
jgi:hypothetical protein